MFNVSKEHESIMKVVKSWTSVKIPQVDDIKRMWAALIVISVRIIIQNPIYKFDKTLRIQLMLMVKLNICFTTKQ